MENIFYSSFKSFNEDVHEIKIYNRLSNAVDDPVTLVLNSPGYILKGNSQVNDIITYGVIETSCSFSIQNTNDILDDFLADLQITENKYLIEIFKNSESIWKGIILSDFGKIDDKAYSSISFEATDGLKLLKSEDVVIIDENLKHSFLDYISVALNTIKTADLFTTEEAFIRTRSDWYGTGMYTGIPMEPLALVSCEDTENNFIWEEKSVRTGYNGTEVVDIKKTSRYDQIQIILKHFNVVLGMNKGRWYMAQRDLFETANTISYFQYTKERQLIFSAPLTPEYCVENTYLEITPLEKNYRNQGTFTALPGLKQVEITYLANSIREFVIGGASQWEPSSGTSLMNYYDFENLLDAESGVNSFQTYELFTGSGNFVQLKLDWKDYYYPTAAGTSSIWNATVLCWLEVKLEGAQTYYLREWNDSTTGLQYQWTLTPTKIAIPPIGVLGHIVTANAIGQVGPSVTVNRILAYQKQLSTPDLPIDGDVIISITRDAIVATTGVLNPNGNAIPTSWDYDWWGIVNEENYLFYVQNNEAPSSSIKFKSVNDNTDFTLVNSLDDAIFGTAGSSSRGFLEIWDGNNWIVPLTTAQKMWAKGINTTKNKYFNELLVDETLANQQNAMLVFSGNIHIRNTSNLNLFQVISLTYKGYQYRMWANNVAYSANEEMWAGDWFQVSRVKRNWVIDIVPSIVPLPNPTNIVNQGAVSAISRLDIMQVTNDSITVDDHILNIDGVGTISSVRPAIPSIGTLTQHIGHRVIKTNSDGTRAPMDNEDLVVYGYLYNFFALADLVNITDGWRVPSSTDWDELINYFATLYSVIPGDAIPYMRSIRQNNTTNPDGLTSIDPFWDGLVNEGTDSLLLSIVGGGSRSNISGIFDVINSAGEYWTSDSIIFATEIIIGGSYQVVFTPMTRGVSVRFVRDASSIEAGLDDGTYVDPYVGNDGKTYLAVKIGDQIWMCENLAETKYNDDSLIPVVTDNTEWTTLATGARCSYNNDSKLAIIPTGIKDITSDTDVFEGNGTADAPLALLNSNDGIVYGVLDGKLVPITDRGYAGVYSVPTFTDNGNGTVTIGSGIYNLFKTTDNSGPIYQYTIAGATFSPTDKTIMYIYADYNTGTPQIVLTNNPEDINQSSRQIIFTIYRDGNTVRQIEWDEPSKGLADKLHNRLIKTERFKKEFTGGLVLSETATRIVNISGGNIWYGSVRKTLPAFISNVDTMILTYHVSGVWTETVITQYNNTQYDDGTDLVTLTNNKYTVNWIYRMVGDDATERVYIVLGDEQYNSAGDASAAPLPTIPDVVLKMGILVGRIIVQKSATSGTVENVQDFTFVGGTSAATPPGGNTTEVQFNDAGSFAGDSTFNFDKNTKVVGAQIITITRDINLTNTTHASGYGVIYKNTSPFIHDFNYGNNGSVTTIGQNTFIGINAGNFTMGSTAVNNYRASHNVGIGHSVLKANTIGYGNVGIGSEALLTNTEGYQNMAVGYQSLYSLTIGYANVGVGTQTLYSTIDGNRNTAVGCRALVYNTGSLNTAIGYESLSALYQTGQNNVGIGVQTLISNLSGNYNIGIGTFGLYNNTSGSGNISAGYYSLFSNATGSYGVAIGYESQRYANDTSTPWTNTNISIGYQALRGSTTAANNTGIYNLAIGYQSLLNNTNGSANVGLGMNTLLANTTGVGNIAIGFNAGRYITDGATANSTATYSIYIGQDTKAKANGETNQIVIGYNLTGNGSNTTTIGNSSTTDTYLAGCVHAPTAKIGGATHYTEFEADGTMEAKGDAICFEDLRVEPTARNTGANAPSFEKWKDNGSSSRGVFLYSFDDAVAGSEKELFFTMQMPHNWKAGTAINLHIHWIGNLDDTTSAPRFGLEYNWADIGSVFPDTTIVYTDGKNYYDGSDDANITAFKHYISKFAAITPTTSQDGISSILIGRIFRDSANAADTYDVANNKCGILYIDAHYEVNMLGSRSEYSK